MRQTLYNYAVSRCLMSLTDAHPRTTRCMRNGLGYQAIGMWEVVGLSRNAITDFLGVPRATVGFWVRKFRKYGCLDRLSVSGRPRATSSRADRRLIRLCKSNRFATSSELKKISSRYRCERQPHEVLSDFHVLERIMCPFKGSEPNICPCKGNHIILLLLANNFLWRV